MSQKLNRKRYDARRRREGANATRLRILDAGRAAFIEQGYAATRMLEIAKRAGVALDTVYAAVGPKPKLFRALVENAISGVDKRIPVAKRPYAQAIAVEPDPVRKLALLSDAIHDIQGRLVPLIAVLQAAAPTHADLTALWKKVAAGRARNMRRFVAYMGSTGALRRGLSVDEAGDVVWAMNSPELYLLLVGQRGWSRERYRKLITVAMRRYLLGK